MDQIKKNPHDTIFIKNWTKKTFDCWYNKSIVARIEPGGVAPISREHATVCLKHLIDACIYEDPENEARLRDPILRTEWANKIVVEERIYQQHIPQAPTIEEQAVLESDVNDLERVSPKTSTSVNLDAPPPPPTTIPEPAPPQPTQTQAPPETPPQSTEAAPKVDPSEKELRQKVYEQARERFGLATDNKDMMDKLDAMSLDEVKKQLDYQDES